LTVLLESASYYNVIDFNGNTYLQIKGCPMGSRISPSLASTFVMMKENVFFGFMQR
jgi:hypothetical protein